MRVAHLIESDGPGGAERVVADLATELQAAGAYNLAILPRRGEGWLARQLAGSGVGVEHFSLEKPLSVACARSIAATLRRHRIDVAHSHEFSMAVYGASGACLAGIPHVITMHGSRYYSGRLRRRVALRAAIGVSACTVAVSHGLAEDIRRDLLVRRSRVATITNGVRAFTPGTGTIRDELRLHPDDRLLVAVGNLYTVKGHVHLVDALAMLAHRHRRLHVAICGRGELESLLVARAREHGVADRVHLLGLRPDVPHVLAGADIFVLPSLCEGLPLALLEAMFAARPIVATNVGDVAAALAHGEAGVLVEPGSPAALASGIDHLVSHPARARELGDCARQRALAEYDVSQMVRRYSAIYQQLLTRNSKLARSMIWLAPQ